MNDGRAFLNNSNEKYDLVVYALTDSLTLVSSTAGVRLESFLFTEESMREARDHLAPGGMFLMYNLYREPWLVAKLDSMLGDVFGGRRLVRLIGPAEAVLAAGPAVDALNGAAPPGESTDAIPEIGTPVPVARDRRLAVPLSPRTARCSLLSGGRSRSSSCLRCSLSSVRPA